MKNFFSYLVDMQAQIFVILTVAQKGETKLTISDKIETDTEFYFRKLSIFPSKMATIKYSVKFNKTHIGNQCVNYNSCVVHLDIYTTEDDQNFRSNCSVNIFGQLRNEYLQAPLDSGSYNANTCKLENVSLDVLHCQGTNTIQDYKPRHYGFSFGYDCESLVRPSLHGLSFNFSIFAQSNKTTCDKIPEVKDDFFKCHEMYPHTSLPNLVGFKVTDINLVGQLTAIAPLFAVALSSNGRLCYKYARELWCHIGFPKCDQINQQVIMPCKETCYAFLEACSDNIISVLKRLNFKGSFFNTELQEENILLEMADWDYLPSINGTIPCYYRPILCESPPNVASAKITNGIKPNDTYLAKSKVEYECMDESLHMEGNNAVTCLYSGEWDKIPSCKRGHESFSTLIVVLPLLLMPLLILVIILAIRRHICMKATNEEYLTRIKQYDAFVSYDYNETDQDFAENIIRFQMEEECYPPFKLCLHRRDFKAAWDIMWNIRNAIENSNSAIIIMSQEYVDSLWCKEEFERCYMEHMKDPAFKLFVVIMEPVEDLKHTSGYMDSFFAHKTYLERDDPKLFQKIRNYLSWVKRVNKFKKKHSQNHQDEDERDGLV